MLPKRTHRYTQRRRCQSRRPGTFLLAPEEATDWWRAGLGWGRRWGWGCEGPSGIGPARLSVGTGGMAGARNVVGVPAWTLVAKSVRRDGGRVGSESAYLTFKTGRQEILTWRRCNSFPSTSSARFEKIISNTFDRIPQRGCSDTKANQAIQTKNSHSPAPWGSHANSDIVWWGEFHAIRYVRIPLTVESADALTFLGFPR